MSDLPLTDELLIDVLIEMGRKRAPRTPECPTLPRVADVLTGTAQWTPTEFDHLEACAYCQRIMPRFEAAAESDAPQPIAFPVPPVAAVAKDGDLRLALPMYWKSDDGTTKARLDAAGHDELELTIETRSETSAETPFRCALVDSTGTEICVRYVLLCPGFKGLGWIGTVSFGAINDLSDIFREKFELDLEPVQPMDLAILAADDIDPLRESLGQVAGEGADRWRDWLGATLELDQPARLRDVLVSLLDLLPPAGLGAL